MQANVAVRRGVAPARPPAQTRSSGSSIDVSPTRAQRDARIWHGRGIPGASRTVSAQAAAADVETISKEGQVRPIQPPCYVSVAFGSGSQHARRSAQASSVLLHTHTLPTAVPAARPSAICCTHLIIN